MKLMLPMHASCSNCQWVYPVNYGGGLVAGDSVDLDITIVEDCCVMLTSQSSTKDRQFYQISVDRCYGFGSFYRNL